MAAALKSAVVAAPAEPGKQRLDSYAVTEITKRLRSATDWLVRCSLGPALERRLARPGCGSCV